MAGGANIVLPPENSSCRFGLQRAWIYLDVLLKNRTDREAVIELEVDLDHFVLLQRAWCLAPYAHCSHLLGYQFEHLDGSSHLVEKPVPLVISVRVDPVAFRIMVMLLVYLFLDHLAVYYRLLFYEPSMSHCGSIAFLRGSKQSTSQTQNMIVFWLLGALYMTWNIWLSSSRVFLGRLPSAHPIPGSTQYDGLPGEGPGEQPMPAYPHAQILMLSMLSMTYWSIYLSWNSLPRRVWKSYFEAVYSPSLCHCKHIWTDSL